MVPVAMKKSWVADVNAEGRSNVLLKDYMAWTLSGTRVKLPVSRLSSWPPVNNWAEPRRNKKANKATVSVSFIRKMLFECHNSDGLKRTKLVSGSICQLLPTENRQKRTYCINFQYNNLWGLFVDEFLKYLLFLPLFFWALYKINHQKR